MINQLLLTAKERYAKENISLLVKSVWRSLMDNRSDRRNIDFLKLIVCGNQRFEIKIDAIVWHNTNYDVVISEDSTQSCDVNNAFWMPLTESNLKLILRLELYHAVLNEYDIFTQDQAMDIWKTVLEKTT